MDQIQKQIEYDGRLYNLYLWVSGGSGHYFISYQLSDTKGELTLQGDTMVSNFEDFYRNIVDILDSHYETVRHHKFFKDLEKWDGKIM